jgi:hypothetical protein
MKRFAFASPLSLLLCTVFATGALAQTKAAAPTTTPPPAKAKFAIPIKGEATIEVIQSPSKFVGNEIVTTYKVKNTSNGPIALLKIDEYWYDKGRNMVSSDTYRHKQPLYPGEVVEIVTHSPKSTAAVVSQATFSHANGKVSAKKVKQFQ